LKHFRSGRHRALISAIVQARADAGLTQRQLAAKLKRSDSFVWKIEAGERRVDILEFIEIARCLDVDPIRLFRKALR
jgi:transcriptional regulator with XRE-family HTH domain